MSTYSTQSGISTEMRDLYILREGEPIDYDALRGAFVVVVDSPRLAELVKRDMRITPLMADEWKQEDVDRLVAKRRYEYDTTCGVSVVIPCHNYSMYVTQALDSVMAQTRPPEDIIVVDDASSDDSASVVRQWIEQHEAFGRVTLITNPKNLDLAETQNVGIRAAIQEHIVCLDADDMIEPRYIETLHDAMLADRSLGVAYSGVRVLKEGQIIEPPGFPAFDAAAGAWEWMTQVSDPPLTCIPKPSMFRRAMWARVGGFQQTYKAGEDVDFWLRGLATGWNAKKTTNERLFTYRVHSGAQMSRARKFTRIDHYKPWMRDGRYPFAAPARVPPQLTDYTHPVVSVIIPVGPGHARYVPCALESLIGQTLRQWEAVIINDSGETLPIEPYPFARVIDIGRGNGAAEARNEGLHAAKAPLVCFLDADDWLLPGALQLFCERYARGDAGYVYGDWLNVDAAGTMAHVEGSDYVHDLQHARGFYAGITVLMSTEHARALQFNDDTQGYEDWDFFIRASINGICGARIAKPVFAYRRSTGTRRAMSKVREQHILGVFNQRYGEFMKGVNPMSPCCGGNGEPVMAAKRAVFGLPPVDQPPAAGLVQMEYIGPYAAPVTYFGKYVGGQNPRDKFAHNPAGLFGVEPQDVDKMANTGQWRRVETAFSVAPEPKVSIAEKVEAAEAIPQMQDVREMLAAEPAIISAPVMNVDQSTNEIKTESKPKRGKSLRDGGPRSA